MEAAARRRVVASPRDTGALNALGLALLQQGRPREALTPLLSSTRLAPESAEGWSLLGEASARLGDLGPVHEVIDRLAGLHQMAVVAFCEQTAVAEALAGMPLPPTPPKDHVGTIPAEPLIHGRRPIPGLAVLLLLVDGDGITRDVKLLHGRLPQRLPLVRQASLLRFRPWVQDGVAKPFRVTLAVWNG